MSQRDEKRRERARESERKATTRARNLGTGGFARWTVDRIRGSCTFRTPRWSRWCDLPRLREVQQRDSTASFASCSSSLCSSPRFLSEHPRRRTFRQSGHLCDHVGQAPPKFRVAVKWSASSRSVCFQFLTNVNGRTRGSHLSLSKTRTRSGLEEIHGVNLVWRK